MFRRSFRRMRETPALGRISHHLTTAARGRLAIASLRLLGVLTAGSTAPALVKRRVPRTDGPLTHFASPPGQKDGLGLATRIFGVCVVAACLLGGVAPVAFGQNAGAVSGVVRDPSGAAAPGAEVVVHSRDGSLRRTATSDSEGRYRIDGLLAGEYLLEAVAPDFAAGSVIAFRIASAQDRAAYAGVRADGHADADAEVDVDIALAQVRTEVIVTSTTTPLSSDQVSKALDTVHRSQMERHGEFSIPEALRGVPGIRVRQQRGPGGNTSIQIRGLRSGDTAILVDGYRLRDGAATDGSGSGMLGDLMAVSTDRVEVLRGSGSSIYGTGATGGAINVVTDQGSGRPHGDLLAEGGGLGMMRGRARFSGGVLNDRLHFSSGLAHLNVRDGVDGSDAFRNSTAHGSAHYAFTPRTSLSVRVLASDSFLQLNDSPFVPAAAAANLPAAGVVQAEALPAGEQRLFEAGQPFAIGRATFIADPNDPDNHRSSSFFSGLLRFTQQLGARGSLRLGYHGLDTNRGFRDGPAGSRFEPAFNNASSFDSRIDTLRARGDWELGRGHLLSLGYEFEREAYDSPSSDENPDARQRVNVRQKISQRSHSVYTQGQSRWLGGKLQLSLSARAQAFRLSRPEFQGGDSPYAAVPLASPPAAYTGDAAVSYHFSQTGTKLRAHSGNAYKAPSLFQRFGSSFFFGSFSPFGDPRLRPERTVAFDTGIDQWVGDHRVRLSATYFYTRLQEIVIFDFSGGIDPATDPFGRFGGYRNTGSGLARGAEFSVAASPAPGTDLSASYTYTNSDEKISQVAAGDFFKAFGVSDHSFAMTLTQRLGRRLEAAFDFFAASAYPWPMFTPSGTRAFRFAGPVKADLVVSYTVPLSDRRNLRVHGKVENLLDNGYFEGGFRSPGIWGTVGLSFGF